MPNSNHRSKTSDMPYLLFYFNPFDCIIFSQYTKKRNLLLGCVYGLKVLRKLIVTKSCSF